MVIINCQKADKKTGFSVIELLVIVAIVAVSFFSLFKVGIMFLRHLENSDLSMRASYLAEEGMEAIRSFRDNTDWDTDGLGSLAFGVDYYPDASTSVWTMESGYENIENFTRVIRFESVERDGQDNIVDVGGVVDEGTIKAIVNINWLTSNGGRNFILTGYFTNFHN
jgi:hypothetical protein